MGAVVVVEAGGIQEWIVAGATELKVIRGGSLLLDQVFREAHQLVAHALGEPASDGERGTADAPPQRGWWAPVVSSGSMTAVFADREDADVAARILRSTLASRLPGLTLSVGVGEFPPPEPVADRTPFQAALGLARRPKVNAPTAVTAPARYVPGTVPCQACGAASAQHGHPERWCAACAGRAAHRPLAGEEDTPGGTELSYELDVIGRATRGRFTGYVGVICADGNAVGRRFQRAADPVALHTLSCTVRRCTRRAITAAVEAAVARHRQTPGARALPFNPVIVGGDDVCLIVPAHVAVLAAAALCRAEEEELPMSAGVLLCHGTLPFSKAHGQAEALLRAAKRAGRAAGSELDAAPHVAFALEMGATPRAGLGEDLLTASPYPASAVPSLLRAAGGLQGSGSRLRRLTEGLREGGRIAERAWEVYLRRAEDGQSEARLAELFAQLGVEGGGPWVGDRSPIGDLALLRTLGRR